MEENNNTQGGIPVYTGTPVGLTPNPGPAGEQTPGGNSDFLGTPADSVGKNSPAEDITFGHMATGGIGLTPQSGTASAGNPYLTETPQAPANDYMDGTIPVTAAAQNAPTAPVYTENSGPRIDFGTMEPPGSNTANSSYNAGPAPQYGYQQPTGNGNFVPAGNGYNRGNGYNNTGNGYPGAGYEEPVTLSEWIITYLIMLIPCVNIVMLFVWAFGKDSKPSKGNWAKASLIIWGASIIISLIFYIAMMAILLNA